MPERKETHNPPSEDDAVDAIGKLIDAAAGQLSEADTRITEGSDGGRGLALIGIGTAACAIGLGIVRLIRVAEAGTRALERIAHPLYVVDPAADARPVLPGDVAPDDGWHQWYRGECLCCGIGVDKAPRDCVAALVAEQAAHPLCNAEYHTAEEIARAFAGPICADGTCCFNALEGAYYCAGHMPEGTVEIEVAVAVVCIDCQKAHGHGPGMCSDSGCATCSDTYLIGGECQSCGGDLVLDRPVDDAAAWMRCGCAVGYHRDRYATVTEETKPAERCSLGWPRATAAPTTSCADDATGVWCAAHCPARVRRESDIVARRVDCARGSTRCSAHCS